MWPNSSSFFTRFSTKTADPNWPFSCLVNPNLALTARVFSLYHLAGFPFLSSGGRCRGSMRIPDAAKIDADVKAAGNNKKTSSHVRPRNIRKKRRPTLSLINLSAEEKEAHIKVLQKELDGLFEYYKDVKDQKVDVELSECGSRNAVIAVLMEESVLPLSRLVDQIYDQLK